MPLRPPSHAVICVATLILAGNPVFVTPAAVSGRVTVFDRGNKPATDVGSAVLWLEGPGGRPIPPRPLEVITEGKEFRPRVTVIPVGGTVSFPNNDPFNHNVFSLTEGSQFDLGLFGRKQSKSYTFTRPGLVRIYCNVHAGMAAFVLVRDNAWFTQPGADGSFTIPGVPAGKYVVHAWHERAAEVTQPVDVTAQGATPLVLELDARGYKFVQHLNKFGQPYARGGARY